jgi:hypothetical protein
LGKIHFKNNKSLTGNWHRAIIRRTDKAKPAEERGRKATGLYEIAGLPGRRRLGFFIAPIFWDTKKYLKGGNMGWVRFLFSFLMMVVFWGLNSNLAVATPIPIQNQYFDDGLSGWHYTGTVGIINTSVASVDGTLYQILNQTVQPNYQYTLTAEVGNLNPTASWAIELFAYNPNWTDHFHLGSIGGVNINGFHTYSVTTNIDQHYIDQYNLSGCYLEVLLYGNSQISAGPSLYNWVTLDGVSLAPVPIPSSLLLLGSGLLGLAGIHRRFKKG